MADFPGQTAIGSLIAIPSGTNASITPPTSVLAELSVDTPSALAVPALAGPYTFVDAKPDKVTETDYPGYQADELVGTADWFESFHVIPRSFAFGNLLTQQEVDIEVYSAYRNTDETWTAFVNNAGEGISLSGQPTLPYVFDPQEGVQMKLVVDTSGEPNVDTTLDFVFGADTIQVPITLQRVVLFPLRPESGYLEVLEFLTEIIPHDDGTEQRIAKRKNPRQLFNWDFIIEEGRERARLENILFEWQRRVFGIPIWHEATSLTVAASIGATTINVVDTDFRDFREGGLALIYQDDVVNDVVTVATGGIGANTLTIDSGILNDYSVGATVTPLRTGVIERTVSGSRYPSGAQELGVQFRVDDNDSNLADVSAWTMLNSKVVLDDNNAIRQTLSESFDQDVTIVDNATGRVYQTSAWTRNKRVSSKTFWTNSVQGLWTIRQLLHALRGRQISFYLPTFAKDFVVTQNLLNGGSTMTVENVGYTQFVRGRQPKNIIRLTFKDGRTPLIRTIDTFAEVDSSTETLTLTDTWPEEITPEEIDRVMYVEEVRFDTDSFRIQHTTGERTVRVEAAVKTVFE